MSLNIVALNGRLTKDIELKKTPSNKSVTQFTLAVNRDKEHADFIQCVAWEGTAELLSSYTRKGSKINVTGRLQTRDYTDVNGRKVYVTEVIVREVEFLDSKKDNNQQHVEPSEPQSNPTYTTDDYVDLPF